MNTLSASTSLHQSELLQKISATFILRPILLIFEHAPPLIYSGIAILPFTLPWNIYSLGIALYLLAELGFHLLFLYRYQQLHQSNFKLQPAPIPNPILRDQITDSLISSFSDPAQFSNCLSEWFYYPDHQDDPVTIDQIQKDNLAQLLSSLLFSSSLENLSADNRIEIQHDILKVESSINHTFKNGHNPNIISYQHTLDPIQAEHRPLLFYLNGTHFSYWFHPGLSSSSLKPEDPAPIILVAGIVGLISLPHYAIYLLWNSRRPMFLVGNLSVSLTLLKPELEIIKVIEPGRKAGEEEYYRRKIQTLSEQSICMTKMLKRHGFKPRPNFNTNNNLKTETEGGGGAFLIGHSLGTCLVAHFVRNHPNYVGGTLSIDPISVLPYIPNLVRGFLYAKPKTVGQLLVRIISKEIGVSTVIQRHFHCYLTTQSIRNCSVTSLSGSPHAGFLFFYFREVCKLTLSLLNPPSSPTTSSSAYTDVPSSRKKLIKIDWPRSDSNLVERETLWSARLFSDHVPFYWILIFSSILILALPPS
ncbi:hypothetical protein PSHT_08723 [Puccinia striiformis]|uniref:AB hydrolase-1 domain-containing protein n=1 Tax=Puccinia striiformis TaxID=27350 RepID=A0A2S4VLP8_9BASI|nr:hypothetical protein PSHT_08723 [Puccinia striiformis]